MLYSIKGGENVYDVKIGISCGCCHKRFELTMCLKGYKAWKEGMLIQDAFPYLTPEQRELLITGLCTTCFTILFTDVQ